jgi:hypothetical protein
MSKARLKRKRELRKKERKKRCKIESCASGARREKLVVADSE